MMAYAEPEVPLHSFFEQSSLFCNSVRNDFDTLIGEVENSFSSINRNVKVAPKQRRKSCTLDLKEFTRSKQNARKSLLASFESMETKWSADTAKLKDWFLEQVETSLSKIQLEIKVSAGDLDISKDSHEIDLQGENSSSSSEMGVISVNEPNTHRLYGASPPPHTGFFSAASHLNESNGANVFQQSTSRPRERIKNTNERRRTTRTQPQRGTNAPSEILNFSNPIHEMDLSEESSSEVDIITVDQRNTQRLHSSIPPLAAPVSRRQYQQNIETLHSSSPPADVDQSVLYRLYPTIPIRCATASPPRESINKKGKKGATSKAKARKGAKTIQLSKQDTAEETSAPDVSEMTRSKMTDWQSLVGAVENAPCKPGLYEIKVWRAKKPAYIGHCDDLQNCISQYRECKPSGEKHLDQFIQRNKDEVSVRYEVYPSVQLAKLEQKKRLKEFLEKNKNLPSYNYRV